VTPQAPGSNQIVVHTFSLYCFLYLAFNLSKQFLCPAPSRWMVNVQDAIGMALVDKARPLKCPLRDAATDQD
jgi:hypothetical protein